MCIIEDKTEVVVALYRSVLRNPVPNTKTLFVCFFQIDKQEEILNNFKIRNYFIFHSTNVVVLLISTDVLNRHTHLLTLILIVTDCHHS